MESRSPLKFKIVEQGTARQFDRQSALMGRVCASGSPTSVIRKRGGGEAGGLIKSAIRSTSKLFSGFKIARQLDEQRQGLTKKACPLLQKNQTRTPPYQISVLVGTNFVCMLVKNRQQESDPVPIFCKKDQIRQAVFVILERARASLVAGLYGPAPGRLQGQGVLHHITHTHLHIRVE